MVGSPRGLATSRARREASWPLGAVVDSQQNALDIGDEAVRLEFLAFEPLLLFRTNRQSAEGPAQGRRHRHRGRDRHGDDDRIEIGGQGADRQADRGDDHLGRAAGVHGDAERERFALRETADFTAEKSAAEFADAGDEDETERHQEKTRIVQDRDVGVEPGKREEDRHEERRDEPAQLDLRCGG